MILEKFLGNSSKKVTTVGEFGEIYTSLLLLGKTRGKSLWKGEGKRKRGDYRGIGFQDILFYWCLIANSLADDYISSTIYIFF